METRESERERERGIMTRRCSYCSHNGHNSRTCPNRGVKLFGVRLTDGSIRKSASMGNLTHYTGSSSGNLQNGLAGNNHDSPGDTPDHGGAAGDGYALEDFVPGSSSSRERKKGSNFVWLIYGFSGFNFEVLHLQSFILFIFVW